MAEAGDNGRRPVTKRDRVMLLDPNSQFHEAVGRVYKLLADDMVDVVVQPPWSPTIVHIITNIDWLMPLDQSK